MAAARHTHTKKKKTCKHNAQHLAVKLCYLNEVDQWSAGRWTVSKGGGSNRQSERGGGLNGYCADHYPAGPACVWARYSNRGAGTELSVTTTSTTITNVHCRRWPEIISESAARKNSLHFKQNRNKKGKLERNMRFFVVLFSSKTWPFNRLGTVGGGGRRAAVGRGQRRTKRQIQLIPFHLVAAAAAAAALAAREHEKSLDPRLMGGPRGVPQQPTHGRLSEISCRVLCPRSVCVCVVYI